MIVLGIDTASKLCEVSLFIDGNIFFQKHIELRSSENLIFWIKDLFKQNGILPKTLDKLAVGVGPGSFTGIRVGLSMARVMSQVLKIPIMGVNYLELLEYIFLNYSDKLDKKIDFIITVMDAMRGEFYTRIYDLKNQKTLVENQIFNLEDLMKKLSELNIYDNATIVKNYDIQKIDLKPGINCDIFDVSMEILQEKSFFLEFASIKNNFTEYYNIKPLYIRKSFAEERREKEKNNF